MQPILLFNSIPNNKILEWSKSKALANDKKKKKNDKMMIIFDIRETIVGKKKKKENVDYQNFSPFLTTFQKLLSQGC